MERVNLDSICEPSSDVVARVIENEIIIVPLVAGIGDIVDELYTLNETGKAIWQKLDGEKTLGQVAGELAGEFSSSAGKIERDVIGFASELLQRGMLTVK